MCDFFENKDFKEKMILLRYGQAKIFEIMKEMKEKNPELSIDIFLCILDKKNDPTTSYSSMSGFQYKYSVELWNKYIFENYKYNFELLIRYEGISF